MPRSKLLVTVQRLSVYSFPRTFYLFLFVATFAAAIPSAFAQRGAVFTITEENDLFARSDRHYTQGLKFTYMFRDDKLPNTISNLSEFIPPFGMDTRVHKFGLALGQNIYTPADISRSELIVNDRPYAGWLYLGLLLQRRGFTHQSRPTVENFEINFGIIGRESYAEEAQTEVHRARGFPLPNGWDNQLKTEPGLALRYSRLWLFRAGDEGKAADLIPHYGASLGNVATYANAGMTLRAGYNIPQDFGAQTIDTTPVETGTRHPKWGLYFFGGLDGRAIAYNAFLDGNLFHKSHHVDKNFLGADVRYGAAIILKKLELNYSYVFRSKEFHKQQDTDAFGSLTLKYKF